MDDLMTPAQYFAGIKESRLWTAEKRLLLAILEQATDDYVLHTNATSVRNRRYHRNAERWLFEDVRDRFMFSFQDVCDILGINSEWYRGGVRKLKGLNRLHTRHVSGAGLTTNIKVLPGLSGGERRSVEM